MKIMAATRLMAAVSVAAAGLSFPTLAADGAWEANYACQITSPERAGAPRVNLLATRKGDVGGDMSSAARFRLFNIDKLSDEDGASFPDTAVEIAGFAVWTGLKATGKQEKSGYALYIPLPDIEKVVGPMEGGRVLRITVQAKGGPVTFEVDLTGSARAVASFRVCST